MRRMKKMTGLLAAVSMMAVSLSPAAVQADSQKVVTLGADLTDSQKSVMLKYFGVSADSVQVIEVTNQEERDTLGSYVPLEQIGTRTLSCAYVQPTASGGIQVKTANLNFVTSNMIAAALSTSGVKNCNVVAACPIQGVRGRDQYGAGCGKEADGGKGNRHDRQSRRGRRTEAGYGDRQRYQDPDYPEPGCRIRYGADHEHRQ